MMPQTASQYSFIAIISSELPPNFFTFSQNFTRKAQSTPINQYELFNLPLRRRWSNGDSETEFVAAVMHEFELGDQSGAYRLSPRNLFADDFDWDSTSTA
eukprot:950022_1